MVEQILIQAGEQVFLAGDGAEGLRQLLAHDPDLIILDIMMPGMDGWMVCAQIRQISNVPIMMFTVLEGEGNLVRSLKECAADDYLAKPFSANVLVARTEALIRRAKLPPLSAKSVIYQDDYLDVNLVERQVTVQGRSVKLTTTEFRLLAQLVKNADRVISFDDILRQVWGPEYCDSVDYVHVYISRLRQKLEMDPKNPHYILTQHGIGYQFRKPVLPFETPEAERSLFPKF
jgi:two-component system KDP operon response regulator KdpE